MNRRSRQTLAASIYGVLSEDGILPSTLPACLRCFMVASCIKIRQLTPREVKVATQGQQLQPWGGSLKQYPPLPAHHWRIAVSK